MKQVENFIDVITEISDSLKTIAYVQSVMLLRQQLNKQKATTTPKDHNPNFSINPKYLVTQDELYHLFDNKE